MVESSCAFPRGPGCIHTVKLTSTGGTTHPCTDGRPGSLAELRHYVRAGIGYLQIGGLTHPVA